MSAEDNNTDARDRPTCVSCKVSAPRTRTEHTLISNVGWRLARRVVGGRTVLEWRCPPCFARFKQTQKGVPTIPPGTR